ncbi:hypothetical protein PHLCEN_2v9796 [Hermanssonia centrifuga]|uniref:DH domain-containing protein n=1 Tax=Hermanssonia centrifuga TaxID=98765 RepID=A0A2R6NPW4_9APHY|nr:hypothetical protein PHLCEN_2v9796 [Hermanssonia centrifuga]
MNSSSNVYSSPGIPLSLPTGEPGSDHAEEASSSRRRSRSHSFSRTFGRAIPGNGNKGKEKSRHERTKSQLADIPFLETQLLPSLRDTIDRMTHPPKPQAIQEGHETHAHDDIHDFVDRDHGHAAAVLSQHDTNRTPVQSSAYTPVYSSSVYGYRSPAASAPLDSQISKATTVISTTPRLERPSPSAFSSKNSTAPRSVLKSALRPPMASSPASPSVPASPGKSLRSVKSMMSTSQLTPNPPSLHSPSVKSPSMIPSKLPSSPLSKLRSNPTTPRTKQKPHPSPKVPQQTPSFCHNAPNSNTIIDDSGSELEREYGRRLNSGRLVIANAVVEPSSSESDASERAQERRTEPRVNRHAKDSSSSYQSRGTNSYRSPKPSSSPLPSNIAPAPARNYPYHKFSGKSHAQFGLGLYSEPATLDRLSGDDDEQSVYDDDDDLGGADPSFSHPHCYPDHRDETRYEDDEESVYEENSDDAYDTFDRQGASCSTKDQNRNANDTEMRSVRRRREALLGLVDGLTTDFGLHPEKAMMNYSESENSYDVQGVAISGSGDIIEEQRLDTRGNVIHNGWSGSASSDNQRKGRSKELRRSASRESTTASANAKISDNLAASRPALRQRNGHQRSPSTDLPIRTRSSTHNVDSLTFTATLSSQDRDPQNEGRSKQSGSKLPALAKQRRRSSTNPSRFNERPPSVASRVHLTEDIPPSKSKDAGQYEKLNHIRRSSGRLDERANETALREREGFGIPASLSYGGVDISPSPSESNYPSAKFVRSCSENSLASLASRNNNLTHAESDLSNVGEDRRHGGLDGLSTVAEALFKNLTTTVSNPRDDRKHSHRPSLASQRRSSSRSVQQVSQPASPTRSPQPSVPLSQKVPEIWRSTSEHEVPTGNATWRSAMPPETYKALLAEHGSMEMQRQELIYELRSSQQEFVKRLRSIVRIFCVPLRRKHSKAWLPDVPLQVSRLFDWFEDIANLHTGISETLESAASAWERGEIVVGVAHGLRGFVPRLEVYQPYIMRVDEVKEMLVRCTATPDDQFGEFVRLGERHIECGGWTLADLLMQPLERLSMYTKNFQRLWELTPRDHPDYLSSFSLYHSSRMVVHVMQEVKRREAEYEFVKELSSRIEGLPPSVQLAQRERRLLWHGELLSAAVKRGNNGHAAVHSERDPSLGWKNPGKPTLDQREQLRNGSRLAVSVTKWDRQRKRATSINSSASSMASSQSSVYTSPATSYSTQSKRDDRLEPALLSPYPDSQTSRSSAGLSPGTLVSAFIFTDVIVLACRGSDECKDTEWRLEPSCGVARILDLSTECSSVAVPASLPDDERIIALDLVPLGPNDLQNGFISDASSIRAVRFSLVTDQSSETGKTSFDEAFAACRRCHAYTLRSLSFPSHSGQYLPHGPHVDLELDTQKSVMEILNTGLPLPKSPSVQISDMGRTNLIRTISEVDKEREERGWWALRFQQVLREMQRQDPMLSLEMMSRIGGEV